MLSGLTVDHSRKDPAEGGSGTSENRNAKRNRSSDELESEVCEVRETLNELRSIVQIDRQDHVKSRLKSNLDTFKEQLREVKRLSQSRRSISTNGHHNFSKPVSKEKDLSLGLLLEEKNECLLVRSRLALIRLNSDHLSYPSHVNWPQICPKLKGTNVDPRKVVFKNCGKIDEVELKLVRPLPKYTTWTEVNKNERMTEDQSITRRRRISYEPNGQETFYGPDSDFQDEGKTEEDRILSRSDEIIFRKAVSRHGTSTSVLEIIADFLDTSVRNLEKKYLHTEVRGSINNIKSSKRRFLGKYRDDHTVLPARTVSIWRPAFSEPTTLKEATAFCDIMFCLRCYKFDCKLHTDFQEIAEAVHEIPLPCPISGRELVEDTTPCGQHCLYSGCTPAFVNSIATVAVGSSRRTSGIIDDESGASASRSTKDLGHQDGRILEMMLSRDSCEIFSNSDGGTRVSRDRSIEHYSISHGANMKEDSAKLIDVEDAESSSESRVPDNPVLESAGTRNPEQEDSFASIRWSRLEKELCHKGLQIYGNNSCLIGRMFKGSKSCADIAFYLSKLSIEVPNGAGAPSELPNSGYAGFSRGTIVRRGIAPKLGRKKVSPKLPLGGNRRRMERDGLVQTSCRQYKPCHCPSPSGCSKDCPCVISKQYCDKYCSCSKGCKNLFRGCQCAKTMCDGRRCPCVSLGRECDPDLCKFCSVEHGNSSSHDCRNMNILLQKKKRILLGDSDVCKGWGVFAGEPVCKNEFIGEYTGELISHEEANKRGTIYDRETSFLFNLNDEFVVDAFRKGSTLKFANHSSRNSNCYTKVLLVAGDHRVGIFAKDNIGVGEELLYDYQYEPDIAPRWAITDGEDDSR